MEFKWVNLTHNLSHYDRVDGSSFGKEISVNIKKFEIIINLKMIFLYKRKKKCRQGPPPSVPAVSYHASKWTRTEVERESFRKLWRRHRNEVDVWAKTQQLQLTAELFYNRKQPRRERKSVSQVPWRPLVCKVNGGSVECELVMGNGPSFT